MPREWTMLETPRMPKERASWWKRLESEARKAENWGTTEEGKREIRVRRRKKRKGMLACLARHV